jgi:hypothetical protein
VECSRGYETCLIHVLLCAVRTLPDVVDVCSCCMSVCAASQCDHHTELLEEQIVLVFVCPLSYACQKPANEPC